MCNKILQEALTPSGCAGVCAASCARHCQSLSLPQSAAALREFAFWCPWPMTKESLEESVPCSFVWMPSGCNVLPSSPGLTEAGANLFDTIGLVPLFPPVASFVPASRSAMMDVLGMHMESTGWSILHSSPFLSHGTNVTRELRLPPSCKGGHAWAPHRPNLGPKSSQLAGADRKSGQSISLWRDCSLACTETRRSQKLPTAWHASKPNETIGGG